MKTANYKNDYNLRKIAGIDRVNTESAPAEAYAFVTFLAGDSDYVRGVIGLAKGLRKVEAAYPLVVAVLPDVPPDHRQVLTDQGCLVHEIPPLGFQPTAPGQYCPFALPSFALNYSKLHLWQFVEFKKMVYLDPNTQVFGNIDHLFRHLEGFFYGVVDCLCDMYSPPCCPRKIHWPVVLGPEPSIYLNCGMFVFEPCLDTHYAMLNTLQFTPPTPFAEQDFLNMFFRKKLRPIPPKYNYLVEMIWRHPHLVNINEADVVHYCAPGSVPWRYTGSGENMDREEMVTLVDNWWKIYNDDDYDFVSDNSVGSSSFCTPSSSSSVAAGSPFDAHVEVVRET